MRSQRPDGLDRYDRQMLVPTIGEEGQRRLLEARVGLVGCGALGSVIATLLVRAGVGCLRIADRDAAELTNLHRQILFTEKDVESGAPKAMAGAAHLREGNSEVEVEPVVGTIDRTTLPGFAEDLDLLVDGTDNFATRFLMNDYAVSRGMPWVYGGVIQTHGMTMTIIPGRTPCLRCVFREMPPPGTQLTAATAGVLNTVVAVVASLEATQVMRLIVDPEAPGQPLVTVSVWDTTFDRIEVCRDPACPTCGRGDYAYLEGRAGGRP